MPKKKVPGVKSPFPNAPLPSLGGSCQPDQKNPPRRVLPNRLRLALRLERIQRPLGAVDLLASKMYPGGLAGVTTGRAMHAPRYIS